MRTTLLLAVLLLSCHQAPPSPAAKAGALEVQLKLDPDPPVSGENKLHVTLRGADGQPVDGATVKLEVDMPAMGAMPEMKAQGAVTAEGKGRYAVAFPLAMQGDWFGTLAVNAPGQEPSTTRFKLSTTRRGFTLEGKGAEAGEIIVPPGRQQLIGVTFAEVEERPLTVRLRAAGRVEVDERKLADVTLKYEAYAQRLFVAETGKAVRQGEPLLTVYSPDLLAAEEQLLTVRQSAAAPEIVDAASRRLTQWDLSQAQISEVLKLGKADGKVTIFAPAAGVVLEKGVVEGAHVLPGTNLYRIGNLGHVWVQAALYERDAPLVAVGLTGRVSLPALPNEVMQAKVSFVAPTVDEKTRTLEARLELVNPELLLKPGMFADVEVEVPLGTRLAVPESALLMSGEHRYAFVDLGEGRLRAVEVEVGAGADGWLEVKGGLEKGQKVATQATFLLSSEAKLRDALPKWGAQ